MEAAIFGLMCLIVGSLVLTTTVHARQQNLERLRLQTKKAKDNAHSLEMTFDALVLVGCDQKLLNLLARYWVASLKQALSYSPDDESIEASLDAARSKIRQVLTGEVSMQPPVNDGEIRRAQGCINKALTHIARLHKAGQISAEEIETWTLYLRKKFVEVAVEAHLAQAEQYLADNIRALASNHYRFAQAELQKSQVHGPEKSQRLAEIEKLAKAIFADLNGKDDTSEADISAEGGLDSKQVSASPTNTSDVGAAQDNNNRAASA